MSTPTSPLSDEDVAELLRRLHSAEALHAAERPVQCQLNKTMLKHNQILRDSRMRIRDRSRQSP